MAVLIISIGLAREEPWPRPRYLKAYDPDYVPPPGAPARAMYEFAGQTGLAEWTDDPHQAKPFATAADALEEWKRQSTVMPTRPDGRPNRPLSAYTISFENAPE